MKRGQMRKRIIALLVSILFILVFFLSISFITEHAEHDCTGHDCTVCLQLHSAGDLLRQLSAALICAASIYTGLLFARTVQQGTAAPIILSTPISLKVRMNH